MTTTPPSAELVALATEAQKAAYAPYSKFHVGAALRVSGQSYSGANVENASYGLSMCAERTAMFSAVRAGSQSLEEVVVHGAGGYSVLASAAPFWRPERRPAMLVCHGPSARSVAS